MATTNHIGLTLVETAQAQKEITVNQAFTRIDALMNTGAKSRSVSTPPISPAAGDVYIVGNTPTGVWSGQGDKIAYFDQIWRFITPLEGVQLWVNDEDALYIYNGANWQSQLIPVINTQSGASYTLTSADVAREVYFTSASAITLTLPNHLYIGFNTTILQQGGGQITFAAASGALRRNRQSHTKSAGQYAVCALRVIGNSGGAAAEYVLSGDTAP